MKSLQESLLDDDIFDKTDIESNIGKFIEENYSVSNLDGNAPIRYNIYKKSGKYYVDVDCVVLYFCGKGKHLTNGTFKFGTVGDFSKSSYSWNTRGLELSGCKTIEDLDGAPEVILGDLNCTHCTNLKSLKGCPKQVERYIFLNYCNNLKDIKDLKNLKSAFMIRANEGINITESDFRKYVPEKVCNRVYGKN